MNREIATAISYLDLKYCSFGLCQTMLISGSELIKDFDQQRGTRSHSANPSAHFSPDQIKRALQEIEGLVAVLSTEQSSLETAIKRQSLILDQLGNAIGLGSSERQQHVSSVEANKEKPKRTENLRLLAKINELERLIRQ